jgi:hypothetical protein
MDTVHHAIVHVIARPDCILHVISSRAAEPVMPARSRGADARPSYAWITLMEDRGRREGWVLAAPMARQQQKKLAAVTTGLAEHSTFPAQWF